MLLSDFESRFARSTLQVLVARCQKGTAFFKTTENYDHPDISSRSGGRKEENGLEELKIIF